MQQQEAGNGNSNKWRLFCRQTRTN